eukprot:8959845-Lingulodinium_polyedra.AAC.1
MLPGVTQEGKAKKQKAVSADREAVMVAFPWLEVLDEKEGFSKQPSSASSGPKAMPEYPVAAPQ